MLSPMVVAIRAYDPCRSFIIQTLGQMHLHVAFVVADQLSPLHNGTSGQLTHVCSPLEL